ncbi:MAG: TMEM175 family protein [Caulobacteraceae bacterium]
MEKQRLEAFSDGVIAIVITIMVLELKTPVGAGLADLAARAPVFLAYALSFANVGLFWNNHHHMLSATERIDGRVLWANLFLLFWLSLVPFAIRWVDETGFAALPTAAYGGVLALAAVAYMLLERAIIAVEGNARLARATGSRWKEKSSLMLYVAAIGVAFVGPWIAIALYICVALMWFVPDRRIESTMKSR